MTQRKRLHKAASGGILREIIDLEPKEIMKFKYINEEKRVILKTIKCVEEEVLIS